MSGDTEPSDAPTGTCDWGDCDYLGRFWRYSHEYGWLPVCFKHTEQGEKIYGDMNEVYRNTRGSFA